MQLLPFLLLALPLGAYERDNPREARSHIDTLKLELHNLQSEMHMIEERLDNQSNTTDQLQEQLVKWRHTKTTNENGEVKPLLEALTQRVQEQEKKANKLEQLAETQRKNIEKMQTALNAIMEALQVPTHKKAAENGYKVKSGDSLDKLARKFKTSVKAIKERNQLKTDTIVVGQSLEIPESK